MRLISSASLNAKIGDSVASADPRPLSTLALELQKQYGLLISYEEAPFDQNSANVMTLTNGVRYFFPKSVPVSFSLPDPKLVSSPGVLLSSVILPLLETYNSTANERKVSVFFEGGYAHIIPTMQMMNGKAVPFQPILSTPVSLAVQDRSCSDALDSLIWQIQQSRGITIAKGSIPVGGLLLHRCTIAASSLPARDVLAQLLDQLNSDNPKDAPRSHFSWALLYDVNTNKFFLSTSLLPFPSLDSVSAVVTTKPAAKAGSSSTASPASGGRVSVPVTKPQR